MRARRVRPVLSGLAIAVFKVVFVSFLVFCLIDISPSDPAQRIAGPFASQEEVAEVRTELGLDRPLPQRYVEWLGSVARGDLGDSLVSGEPVTQRLGRALPVTVSLIVATILFSTVVGLLAGVWAAVRQGRVVDAIFASSSSLLIAIPQFWLAVVLVTVFAVNLGWLPAVGYSPFGDGPWAWASSLVLPTLALGCVASAELARQTRSAVATELDQQYVLAAVARGIPRRRVIWHHTFRNAAIPIVAITGLRTAQLIGGAVIIEAVFAMRGVGSLAIGSSIEGDTPVVLGVTLVSLLAVTVINLVSDVAYAALNPKLRHR